MDNNSKLLKNKKMKVIKPVQKKNLVKIVKKKPVKKTRKILHKEKIDKFDKLLKKADEFHWHEILHVSSIIAEMFNSYIYQNAATQSDKYIKLKTDRLLGELWDYTKK